MLIASRTKELAFQKSFFSCLWYCTQGSYAALWVAARDPGPEKRPYLLLLPSKYSNLS